MNNDYGIDYAKPGFCSLCHAQIADFDGFKPDHIPNIIRFHPTKKVRRVQLDDGSGMDVNLCSSCDNDFTPDKMQQLMESEARGWQWEAQYQVDKGNWTQEHADKYIAKYRKRHVVNCVDTPWSLDDIKKIKKPRRLKQELRKQ